jgi:hypothetical protein
VVIPPHKTAVLSIAGDTQRDHHIEGVAQQGRLAWQRIMGYNLRNYAELANATLQAHFRQRHEGARCHSRKPRHGSCVRTEQTDHLGMPVSVKV